MKIVSSVAIACCLALMPSCATQSSVTPAPAEPGPASAAPTSAAQASATPAAAGPAPAAQPRVVLEATAPNAASGGAPGPAPAGNATAASPSGPPSPLTPSVPRQPLACVAPPDPELDRESPWSQELSRQLSRELPRLVRCTADITPGEEAHVTLRLIYGKSGAPLSQHVIASPNAACGAAQCIAEGLARLQAPKLLIDQGAYDLPLVLERGAPPQRTEDEQAGLAPDGAAEDPASCVDDTAAQLSRSKVDDIVKGSFDRLENCYVQALTRDHRASGQVTFEFTIGRDGAVEWARAREATLYDCDAIECMLAEFRTLRFPEPLGRGVRVIYPIRYNVEQPPVQLR